MAQQRTGRADNVRIGPISLFTLIIVLCMAVLAVLAFSTAHASLVMAERQATATTELYLDEVAAQEFVAGIDAELSAVRASKGSGTAGVKAVSDALVKLRDAAQDAVAGQVEVAAGISDSTVTARFECQNGRTLYVAITILSDATYRIDTWKMSAVQNEAQPEGSLWTGA
ncbi:MAG: S4A5 electrogenic sodium bicarbonate cotransporter 4 [Coriobacteriaceae bacterium]|nr:S4A5 electrogenic sodium bicarbonate cotransporter 4 [Coriobacteriaceae bacterium]